MKFQTTLIASAITLCLFSFVGISDAINIEQMAPTDGSYEVTQIYNRYLVHTEMVKTDVPYSRIEWYVDNVLRETSSGDGIKTEATFQPYFLSGSAAGTDYVIKAIAYPWDGDGSDTDFFTLTVFLPFQIVKMRPVYASDYYYNWRGGESHRTYVETSEPYMSVDWYLDGIYQYTSLGNNVFTSVEFTFSGPNLFGSITGETHPLMAKVWYKDVNGDFAFVTESYDILIYKPIVEHRTSDEGIIFMAAINRHFYENGSIIATHQVGAYTPTGKGILTYRYKREVTYPDGTKTGILIKEGIFAMFEAPPEHDFPVSIRGAGPHESWAYTRIESKGEGATATSTETFDIEND